LVEIEVSHAIDPFHSRRNTGLAHNINAGSVGFDHAAAAAADRNRKLGYPATDDL